MSDELWLGRTTRLGGATTAKLGSTYKLSGRTGTVNPARATGTVVLRGPGTEAVERSGDDLDRPPGAIRTGGPRPATEDPCASASRRPDGYVATGTLSVA